MYIKVIVAFNYMNYYTYTCISSFIYALVTIIFYVSINYLIMIHFVIDMMNSFFIFYSLPTNYNYSIIILSAKITRHHFFLLCFNSAHCNSLGIYRGNIFVGKIPWKFTNENIPSIFPFIFINFLIVTPSHSSVIFHCSTRVPILLFYHLFNR